MFTRNRTGSTLGAWASLGLCGVLVGLAACTFDASGIPAQEQVRCGNGVVEGDESCDGADLGGQSCESLQLGGGILSCTVGCTFNTSGCDDSAFCGNGIVEGNETCDDGNTQNGDGCSNLCQVEGEASCGNGVLDPGEECDDGNALNNDACPNTCEHARCGDGFVQQGVELCEPGTVSTTCEGLGYLSGNLACRPDCMSYDLTDCLRDDFQDCTEDFNCTGGECFKEGETGWPGGMCTRPCDSGNPCPSNGECLDVENVGGRCFQRCTAHGDCRQGYACFDPWELGFRICHPLCESDADCPVTGSCNGYLGQCDTPSGGSGDFADACESRQDCLGYCWTRFTSGYCTARCRLDTRVCPGNGVCVDVSPRQSVEIGLCLRPCQLLGFDCETGQLCEEHDSQDVCWGTY